MAQYHNGIKDWKIFYFVAWMVALAALVLMETKTCSPECILKMQTQKARCN